MYSLIIIITNIYQNKLKYKIKSPYIYHDNEANINVT